MATSETEIVQANLHIVLLEPEIPGNTGSIGRLCVGLNASLTLIEPLGYSLEDKYLRRAGLDYWPHLQLQVLPDWQTFEEQLQPQARRIFLTTKSNQPYTSATFCRGDYLVFGKETQGLPKDLRELYSQDCYCVPMFGPIRSLNLAMTAGIVAYEAMRQITGGYA